MDPLKRKRAIAGKRWRRGRRDVAGSEPGTVADRRPFLRHPLRVADGVVAAGADPVRALPRCQPEGVPLGDDGVERTSGDVVLRHALLKAVFTVSLRFVIFNFRFDFGGIDDGVRVVLLRVGCEFAVHLLQPEEFVVEVTDHLELGGELRDPRALVGGVGVAAAGEGEEGEKDHGELRKARVVAEEGERVTE